MHPDDLDVGGAGQIQFARRVIDLDAGDSPRSGGQFFQPAGDGWNRRLVPDQKMLGEAGRDQEGAARSAQSQFVPNPRILGPGRGRAAVTDREVEGQTPVGGVIGARGVVARCRLRLGEDRPVRPHRRQDHRLTARRGKDLHMVVETGAEEALQLLSGQDDALQHRRQLFDRLDAGAAELQLVPHPARQAQMGLVHA
ncbi:hypothetical protein D3C80_795530 [compost metagenome]